MVRIDDVFGAFESSETRSHLLVLKYTLKLYFISLIMALVELTGNIT